MEDPEDLPTRDEFTALLWADIINAPMDERWIDEAIQSSERDPTGPFADIGPLLQRLLALGVSKRDLSLLQRATSYQAVFRLLYLIEDPGIEPEEAGALYEDLLAADPSGMEGRPGSAPGANA